MGIYSIKKFGLSSSKGRDRVGVGIRSSYIRVLGIQVDTDGSGELVVGPCLALHTGCAVPWADPTSLLHQRWACAPLSPTPHPPHPSAWWSG